MDVASSGDDAGVNHQTSVAAAQLSLHALPSLAPSENHPIGMKAGFFLIVAVFLAILGLTMAVGHLREQRRQRRAQSDLQGSRRDAPPRSH